MFGLQNWPGTQGTFQHLSSMQVPAPTQRWPSAHLPGTHRSLHAPSSQNWPDGQVTFRHLSVLQTPPTHSWVPVHASDGSLQSRQRPSMQILGDEQVTPVHRSTQAPVFSSQRSPDGQLTLAQRCGMQKPLTHL